MKKVKKVKSTPPIIHIPNEDQFQLHIALSVTLLRIIHPNSEIKQVPLYTTKLPDYIIGIHPFQKGKSFMIPNYTVKYPIKRQRNGDYFNDNKKCRIPLSLCGKIFKTFGKSVIQCITGLDINDKRIGVVYERMYFDWIEIIDAYTFGIVDSCGVSNKSTLKFNPIGIGLINVVERYGDNGDVVEQFEKVVELLKLAVVNYINYFVFSFFQGEEVVKEALINDNYNQILVLDKFVPWKEHLFNLERKGYRKVLYVVYPDSSNDWRVSAVPIKPSSYESRKKFPNSWRGLEKNVLRETCGIEDAEFVHSQGFIAGAITKEGCIKLSLLAVKNSVID